eukprot:TCALIF_00564-PA protein Name:"Similar to Ubp1 Upstream-binding protein 1 (Mus musculus)" AED:0.26 eAED:0.64 QI:0/-1/0/1/-1/1/1/0/921
MGTNQGSGGHKDKEDLSPALGSSPGSAAAGPSGTHNSHSQDSDLFSFLSAMHLSNGGASGMMGVPSVSILANRKRKFLEQGGALGGGKHNVNMRPPYLRRGSNDDDENEFALHTPQCSQSGYADEEDHHHHQFSEGGHLGASGHHSTHHRKIPLSPSNAQIISDIDDNLATNFEDSLSGLGVDISSANYSMSEALLALPNLSISSSHIFKGDHHGDHSPPGRFKEEPGSGSNSRAPQNFGALDLSNDEAHLPDSPDDSEIVVNGPKTFTGSVSRDGSRDGTPHGVLKTEGVVDKNISAFGKFAAQNCTVLAGGGSNSSSGSNLSSSNPNLAASSLLSQRLPSATKSSLERRNSTSGRSQKVILPLQTTKFTGTIPNPAMAASNGVVTSVSSSNIHVTKIEKFENLNDTMAQGEDLNRFQYILAASTSLATKLNEPSITYLNQGQAYELRLKKLGDLSAFRRKNLKCVMRICFHERRLQYMEAEQILEWKNSHPGERILEIDLPLSFGAIEPEQESMQLNAVSFKWDPTRETGIFIKVNCISTEFTPKKHGGEKGVPFRLQVETFDPEGDVRLHAAGCILQVFKLKGADRKHKQDRDKINKRPQTEQEKFAPSYDCTVLNELSVENIYVPPSSASRSASPTGTVNMKEGSGPPSNSILAGEPSPSEMTETQAECLEGASTSVDKTSHCKNALSVHASCEGVMQWLSKNRYSNYIGNFKNFNGRDMMRLMREELMDICGTTEGIRLFNDLHMTPVAPRTSLYVAEKGSNEYHALFLEELTVREMMLRFCNMIGVDYNVFAKASLLGPRGILVGLTDSLIEYFKPETVMHFTIRTNDRECEVIFENVTGSLDRMGKRDLYYNGSSALPEGEYGLRGSTLIHSSALSQLHHLSSQSSSSNPQQHLSHQQSAPPTSSASSTSNSHK